MSGLKEHIIKKVILFLCIFITMGLATGCSSETDDNDYEKEENNSSSFLQDILIDETEPSNSEIIEFSDFLVERCVREKLGKDWEKDITYEEIQEIEELDICNTYDPTFAIGRYSGGNAMGDSGYNGYIDLIDLKYFKNLKVLRVSANVAYDSIVNVDTIANCTKLEELVLPCAASLQKDSINLAGYKYWKEIFAKLPKLEKVDLGIYVDDDMKEIMLSETSNKEIEFDKGSKTYDYDTEIDYYFYKTCLSYNPSFSWFEADPFNYAEEWDYGYKSISMTINNTLYRLNNDYRMFPAIVADDESSLEKQLSDVDDDIEDLIVVIGNFEFDFELLERFDDLVTLTIINENFHLYQEEIWDSEREMYIYGNQEWCGATPKNGDALSGFDNLQVLNLSGFVGDLSFVKECDKLRELSMISCAIDSTDFIGKMKTLKELTIRVHDNQDEYTDTFYKKVNDELMKLTKLKYLKDQNPNHSGEEYKDINEMKTLETLWLDEGGENENTIHNILQSRTIKNLAIADFVTILDDRFDQMKSLESIYLGFYYDKVEKEFIYSLVELDTIKSIALGQISMDEGHFEDIYTKELAERAVKNENMSAFLISMDEEEEIKQSIDKDFVKTLYEAGVKESVYSHFYLQNNENLTIDEFLEWE